MGNCMDNEMTDGEFIAKATELINSLPPCAGDLARLGHWLSMALNRLETATGLQPGKSLKRLSDENAALRAACKFALEKMPSEVFHGECIHIAETLRKALKQ